MNKIKAARYYAKGRLKTVLMPFIDARGEEWQIFCKLWAFTSGFLYGKRKTKKGQKLSNDLIHSNKTAGYLSTIQRFFIKENWLGAILQYKDFLLRKTDSEPSWKAMDKGMNMIHIIWYVTLRKEKFYNRKLWITQNQIECPSNMLEVL